MKSGDPGDWLLFIATVPGKSTTPRSRLWRALKDLGAAVLRDGVYLLPARPELRRALEKQAQAVRTRNGSAYVFDLPTPPGAESTTLAALFDRQQDYTALLEAIARLRGELVGLDEAVAERTLRRLRRDFEAVRAIDYFPGAGLAQAEQALQDAAAAVARHLSPDEPQAVAGAVERCEAAVFRGRVWATRAGLRVDRVCSAWLIRRCIDPEARFVWLARPRDCPPQAVGFDFDGAAFTHFGERVSFEVLLASFALDDDPALARLGTLVHYLDVGGNPVAEAEGFAAVLAGLRAVHAPDDDALLAATTPVLDALYTAFGRRDEVMTG